MNQEIRFCSASDGVKLAYAVSGHGSPVAMCATWLTHLEHQWASLAWQPWLEELSSGHTLLRYDSRGCGLSDRAPGRVSFETWMRDFESVMDASGIGACALVGTCWGGPIAIEYARRHPDRVTHLVLYGTYARGRLKRGNIPGEVERARMLLDLLQLGWGQENHAFLQVWATQFQPGGTLEHLRSWCDQQRAATSAATARHLFEVGYNVDVTESARSVRCPALVLHADRDVVVPIEEGRNLAKLIPDCRFVELASENHMPLADEDSWRRIVTEMGAFLRAAPRERPAQRQPLALRELSPRERTVLECVARGQTNSEIAASLDLSEKTVRNHITRIFDKIGVEHRYQAIVLAREAGFGFAAAGAPASH